MVALAIEPDFGYVLLSVVGIAVQCFITGFVTGSARKVFNKEFMSQFAEEHKKVFLDQDPPRGGYPDNGNGYYGRQLSYQDWVTMASAQRAHYNFLESLTTVIVLLVVAGLFFPIVAAVCGFAIFIGRILYTIGYLKSGPQGRLIGVIIIDLATVVLIVTGFWGAIKFIGLKA